jgi:8-oxo-dGTP pyrophosphatase MutT (NUDIX family)
MTVAKPPGKGAARRPGVEEVARLSMCLRKRRPPYTTTQTQPRTSILDAYCERAQGWQGTTQPDVGLVPQQTSWKRFPWPEGVTARGGCVDELAEDRLLRLPRGPKANSLVPAVNVVVVNDEDEILLVRRTDNGNRVLPGGGVDLGESVAQAAVRETLEESGIQCAITGIVGIYSDPRHDLPHGDPTATSPPHARHRRYRKPPPPGQDPPPGQSPEVRETPLRQPQIPAQAA